MTQSRETADHLLLLGHPPASEFFQVMRTRARSGTVLESGDLVHEWRAARAYVRELEEQEAGLADGLPLKDLPPEMAEAAEVYLNDPAIEEANRMMQRRWVWVELDRVAIFQKCIDLAWVRAIQTRLGRVPGAVDIVNVAAGTDVKQPPIEVVRSTEDSYVFSCNSSELQFFGTKLIDPAVLPPELNRGSVGQVLAAFVGFGLRTLSVIRYRGRLILLNGTHRAYALRDLGLSHVPCVLVDVEHPDELELAGVGQTASLIERCARVPRPPLFKDYFDSRQCKLVSLERTRRAIQMQITCTSIRIPRNVAGDRSAVS